MSLHPTLRLLLKMQLHARLRAMRQGLFTRRGAALAVLALVMLGFVLLSALAPAVDGPMFSAETRLRYAPLALLLLFATSLLGGGDSALGFSGAEVGMLFPAPIPRRELVRYKILHLLVQPALLSPLWIAMLRQGGLPVLAGTAAVTLALSISSLATAALLLTREALQDRFGPLRGLAVELAGWSALLLTGLWSASSATTPQAQWDAVLTGPLGYTVLLPGRCLGLLLSPELSGPSGALLGATGLALTLAGLALGLLQMDERFIEAGITRGERLDARIDSFRRGDGVHTSSGRVLRVAVPMLPRLRGVGTLAWVSLVTALRTPAVLLTIGTVSLLCTACVAIMHHLLSGPPLPSAGALAGLANSATIVLTSLPGALRLDFRGDVERVVSLRALPLHPGAVVAGVVLPTWTLLFALHAVMVVAACAFEPVLRPWAPAMLVIAALLDAQVLATDNALFLTFPSREAGSTAIGAGVQRLLLQLLGLAINGAALGAALAAAVVAGLLTSSPAAAVAVGLFGLLGLSLTALTLTVLAYQRFDPSLHTPA